MVSVEPMSRCAAPLHFVTDMGGSTDALSIVAGMSSHGWLPAWRKLFDPDHDLAPSQRDPASRGWAWIDLCQMAAHKPYTKRGVRLERGEILVAVRFLAPRWWWSKSRVSRFLVQLESGTRIGTVRGTPFGTVYSIVNYDTYADVQSGVRDTKRDKARDRSGTAAGQIQPLDHSTKQKKDSVGNGVTTPTTALFVEFWKVAAKKVGKLDAEKSFTRAMKRKDADTLMERWAAFNAGINGGDMKYVPNPSTWLNQGRWLDEDPQAPAGETGTARPTGSGGFYVGN